MSMQGIKRMVNYFARQGLCVLAPRREPDKAESSVRPVLHNILKCNPKGIASQSPGLRVCELPWERVDACRQPQRGCGRFGHTVNSEGLNPFRVGARFESSTQSSSQARNPDFCSRIPSGYGAARLRRADV